ncbi:MAG: ABC transporter ATP-binding protein [Fimbriimonadaceae bacterium]
MILSVENVTVEFAVPGGLVRALDGVSLQVKQGETVAVVGESGCGKTTLARAILGLQPLAGGNISLLGKAVEGPWKGMGKDVGMVWQDPYASLDPRWKVSRSIVEAADLAGEKVDASELFDEVGLDRRWLDRFPHQLSGGQRQRVAIGRAVATRPPLVICDEPTAALDLSIRAQILNMLKEVQRELNVSYLYISHDLLTVRFLADRVAVMYLGRIVEEGPTEEVFEHPRHPYTKALMDSAPTMEKLLSLPEALPGELPDPRIRFDGCRFASRCEFATKLCVDVDPGETAADGHRFYCHHPVGR